MRPNNKFFLLISVLLLALLSLSFSPNWGFFGHKRINRLAVFTLPVEMMPFYKKHIEYITEHSVDPDKRRYASNFEAIRHYIDIDHWGEAPFAHIPRNWTDMLAKYTDIYVITENKDTVHVFGDSLSYVANDSIFQENLAIALPYSAYRKFIKNNIVSIYYEEEWRIPCDSLYQLLGGYYTIDCSSIYAEEEFTSYGILPYHLKSMQYKLTEAFENGDIKGILRHSSDFGHYIADAHVPLHTTENYNGQMTNQLGIHAFWESRLPELYADEEFDFFVGRAEYIEDKEQFFWDIVLKSHSYVDEVLDFEKQLRKDYPSDQQFCYEERNGRTVRIPCSGFSRAYYEKLDGQVEERMCEAIYHLGCAWYTAWIDAGQPDLINLGERVITENEEAEVQKLNEQFNSGTIKGRNHGQ